MRSLCSLCQNRQGVLALRGEQKKGGGEEGDPNPRFVTPARSTLRTGNGPASFNACNKGRKKGRGEQREACRFDLPD